VEYRGVAETKSASSMSTAFQEGSLVAYKTICYSNFTSSTFHESPLESSIICGMLCGVIMKPKGMHRSNVLSAVKIRNLKAPGRYADGNGLYLVVEATGAKRWIQRLVVQGKRRDIGLGGFSLISLAEAREAALAMRKKAREGSDPLAERRKTRLVVPTFEQAAGTVHAEHSPTWRNQKHAAQWITTLKEYVFPIFGGQPVDKIGTPES